MLRLMARGLGLLLVVVMFGVCAPEDVAAQPLVSLEIARAGHALQGITCDVADPGARALPGAKADLAAVPVGAVLVERTVLEPVADVRLHPAPTLSRIALDVLAPRAPPRA